jgi:hypothetical protein
MYRKIAIAGATAAVIIGSGTAALAATDTTSGSPSTPSGTPTTSASTAKHPKALRVAARRSVHGQVVTKGKDGKFVTHDFAKGVVTAVSSSSIAVKTADGKSETYTVNSSTKVRVRTNGKGAAGKITDVHVGDSALVAGTGTGTPTAMHIVDVGKR